MLRSPPLFLFLALAACTRTATTDVPPSVKSAPSAAPALAPVDAAAEAAVAAGPHATDEPLSWAFWTRAGALVAASKTDLWKVATSCGAPQRVPFASDRAITQNGADRFVVERGGAFVSWDAATLQAGAPIDHPAAGRGGALSPDGARVALGGCKEIAGDPKLMTTCGELYDAATGQHTAGFVATHELDALAFSEDGRYLVARSGAVGLSVFDAATGKKIVSRPRWSHVQEVHGWNRPDVADVAGDELVIAHGDTVEHVDLASGKTLGKLVTSGRTLAVYGPKTRRVAVLQGEAGRAQIWDVASHKVIRTFELAKHIAVGANCRHCALEIDEIDEDRVWLTSNYTADHLLMRIGSGEVKRSDLHSGHSESLPSATHRVEETYDNETRQAGCALDRRDSASPRVPLPVEYCNRVDGQRPGRDGEWPYPGFDPSGRFLAAIQRSQLRVWDLAAGKTVCVVGARGGGR